MIAVLWAVAILLAGLVAAGFFWGLF